MALKSILLHLARDRRVEQTTAAAIALAKRHGARLVAASPLPPVILPMPDGGFISADLIQKMSAEQQASAERSAAKARTAGEAAGITVTTEVVEGDPVSVLSAAAVAADLVVIGQPDPDSAGGADVSFPGDLLMASSRPVLCLPYAGTFPTLGDHVLVAWNGSREAARAVADALPLLEKAATVMVVTIDDVVPGGAAPEAVAGYLKMHGIAATVRRVPSGEISAEDALLGMISDQGIDLVVMGAYGHSRTRELLFGGVTRSLLRFMTSPLLLSH
jgi:nucleotide-binding universal stress UspA family protein